MQAKKSTLRALLIRVLLRFFSLLPLPLVQFVGMCLGLLVSLLPNQSRRVSLVNIALCYPQRSHDWQLRFMRKSLMETGKALAEFGPLWLWKKQRIDKLVTRVYDQGVFDDALSEGRGLLLAIPHMGTWELVNPYHCARMPMTIMFRPSRIPELDSLIRASRERFGAKLVPTNASGIRAMVVALAKGEIVGMLPDQEPAMGSGCFAPFFGVPAYTPILLSKLGARKRVPVVFAVAERQPFGAGYSMHYRRAGVAIYAADPAVAAAEINRCVEQCIGIAPQQYVWNYKRFHALPDGGLRRYKKPVRE